MFASMAAVILAAVSSILPARSGKMVSNVGTQTASVTCFRKKKTGNVRSGKRSGQVIKPLVSIQGHR